MSLYYCKFILFRQNVRNKRERVKMMRKQVLLCKTERI